MKPFDLSQYMLTLTQAAGAGLVGYNAANTYAAGTVGAALKTAGATLAGLGTMATQNANAVNITGGSIQAVNPLAVGRTAVAGTSPLQVNGDVSILTSPAGGMGYNFNTYWLDGNFKAHADGFSGAVNFYAGTGDLSLLVSAASVTGGATTAMQTVAHFKPASISLYKPVGINRAAPTIPLDVYGAAASGNAVASFNNGGGRDTDVYFSNDSVSGNSIISRRIDGSLWFYNSATHPFLWMVDGAEKARVNQWGINTPLTVAAAVHQLDGQNYWNLSGGYHPYYNQDSNDYMIYNRSADEFQFIIGGVHQASVGWNSTCLWARDQIMCQATKANWASYVGANSYLHQNGSNEGIVQLGPAAGIKANTSGGIYFDVNADWAFHCAPDRNLRTRLSIFPLTHGGGHSGWPGIAWADCYAHSYPGPSDEREKDWRGGLSPEELAAAKAIVAEIGAFRWLFELERDGDKAGYHIGVRAQQVWRIMADHGLIPPLVDGKPSGPNPYSFIRYEEWDEEVVPPMPEADVPGPPAPQTPPVGPVPVPPDNDIPDTPPPDIEPVATAPVWEPYQPPNHSTEHVRPAGSIFMVAVQELSLFLIAAQEQRLAALEALLP